MDENLSVEQRIARFLEANDITIIPVNGGDGIEILEFVQHMTGGTTRELGGIFYNRDVGMTQAADVPRLGQCLQLPEFVAEVRRPMSQLLAQVKGDFYADQLGPIHDACDKVEAKYAGR
ncbi:MAG: hypothetical protein AABX00_05895 [Nanoarchaeota archaeon]